MSLLRITAGIISQPASGSLSSDHLRPRALRSERVIVSRSSPPLRPDPPVSPAPPDFTSSAYTGGRARRLGLGCERHLPCFGSALPPHVRPPLRREEKQVHIPAESLLPWPSPHNHGVGSSTPDIGFRRDSLSTLLSVRFATARVIACPPGPIRPGETSLSGRRGLCTRAFPREGLPSRESGIATRHPGRRRDRTSTGWSTAVTGCTVM
jgi:hypothetical protein